MNNIKIYKDGDVNLEISLEDDTLWLQQAELSELFDKNQSVISRHINNIFNDNEVDKKSNMQKKHIAFSDKPVNIYSLDIVLAVGYRTNSSKAIRFRQWATKVLKQYLVDGYAIDKEKLQQQRFDELTLTLKLIEERFDSKELNIQEAKGFAKIISNYARSWALLQGYDDQSLEELTQQNQEKFVLDYKESKEAIKLLKDTLISKGQATELFTQEKAGELEGHLLSIYQTFAGVELLPSFEQKASNLLYYVVKGHPFVDGNKRIGAYLFILFLSKNKAQYRSNRQLKIDDNTLTSLTLLVATSKPDQKDMIIKLVINMLYDGEY